MSRVDKSRQVWAGVGPLAHLSISCHLLISHIQVSTYAKLILDGFQNLCIIGVTTQRHRTDKMNVTVKVDIDNEALKASGITKDKLQDLLHRAAKDALLMTAHTEGLLTRGSMQETMAQLKWPHINS